MKKILFSLIAVMISLTAMAGSDIKVTQGDKKFFKTASGSAAVEILWQGATYDKKKPVEEKFADIDNMCKSAKSDFAEKFNDKSKTIKVDANATDADYKFSIKLTNVDQFMNVMSFVPGLSTNIWGTMTITNGKTGETLVVIEIKDLNGGNNPSPNQSFNDSFQELAKQLLKLK